MTEKKFKEKYLAGEIAFEEIDDYSQDWGFSEEPVTLREYLGLNEEEEDAWVSVGDEALRELLDRQKTADHLRDQRFVLYMENSSVHFSAGRYLFPVQIQNCQCGKNDNIPQRVDDQGQHIHRHIRIIGAHTQAINGVGIIKSVTLVGDHESQNTA